MIAQGLPILAYAVTDGFVSDVIGAMLSRGLPGVLASIAFIVAIGWAIATTVDALIMRQLSRLKLDDADNLQARKIATRLDVVRRIWVVVAGTITAAAALTVVPGVQQIGVSLFASAGIAGLGLGLAARPVLSNLIAGLQIAFTQPVRIDDAVVVEGEWGWIEEIGLFYVTIKIWDWRRLVVLLSYLIENPFQNWTRQSASIIGSVFWSLDHRVPVGAVRAKLEEICRGTDLWGGDVVNLQVTEADGHTVRIRALASATTSPRAWDLTDASSEKKCSSGSKPSMPMRCGVFACDLKTRMQRPQEPTLTAPLSLTPALPRVRAAWGFISRKQTTAFKLE